MKVLWVVAEIAPGRKDPDGARGVWEVEFQGDLPEAVAVGAALDTFHGHVVISEVDDFTVTVLDPETLRPLCEDEKYEQGSYEGRLNGLVAGSLNQLLRDRKIGLVAALKKAPTDSQAAPLRIGDISLWRKCQNYWTQMDGGGVQFSRTAARAVEKALALIRRRWTTSA